MTKTRLFETGLSVVGTAVPKKYGPFSGGDEENRTPVQKPIHKDFSGCSLWSTFPYHRVHKQTLWFGSFIVHGRRKALAGSRSPLIVALNPAVVL